jgi:hypothetical protein
MALSINWPNTRRRRASPVTLPTAGCRASRASGRPR